MQRSIAPLVLPVLAGMLALPAAAQEWSRFRGPNGTGISPAKTIPTQFSAADFHWKVKLPGVGHSSPILWGKKVFLTGSNEATGGIKLFALDADTGRLLWEKEHELAVFRKHKFNSFASPSAATDAERVYFCWSDPAHFVLAAYTHDGDLVWKRDLGPYDSQHGCGVSPIVHEGMVILPNEQLGKSFLLAVDAATGKDIWRLPRNSVRTAYCTPCVMPGSQGRDWLVFNSQGHGIYGVDAKRGTVVWEYPEAFDKRSCSSPVVAGPVVIGSCGSGGGGNFVTAVFPGDPESNRPARLAWQMRRSAPYVPTPLYVDGLLYCWSDGGMATCIEPASGKVIWQERAGGNYFGSPIWVNGRLFNITTGGEVVVLRAGRKFEVLARNPLDELTHTTPAIAHGRMYLRTFEHLISLGGPVGAE